MVVGRAGDTLVTALRGALALWAVSLVELLGVWLFAHVAGALVVLWAVEVAEDPRYAGALDAVRGNNPRAQGVLYAPGAAPGAVGALHMLAVSGVSAAASGRGWAWPLVVLPLLLVPIAWTLRALARRTWFQGSVVLAEIRGRYELETPKSMGGFTSIGVSGGCRRRGVCMHCAGFAMVESLAWLGARFCDRSSRSGRRVDE